MYVGKLGAYSLGAYSLGAYSLGGYSLGGLESGGLLWATDFGSASPLTTLKNIYRTL